MTQIDTTLSAASDGSTSKTMKFNILEHGNSILFIVGGWANSVGTIVSIDKISFALLAVNSITPVGYTLAY